MERYYGNQFPYIYVAFPEGNNIENYIEKISQEGVRFCAEDSYDKSSGKKIESAYAVLVFLTREFVKESRLRNVISDSVRYNKQLLCVFLEDVQLDATLTMQTEAQQALFVNRYQSDDEFTEALKKAEIFNHMSLTAAQLNSQKQRTFSMVGAVALAAVLLFVLVIKPLLIPNTATETMDTLGLQGLSRSELESIRELRIVGNRVVDSFSHAWYLDGGRTEVAYDKMINDEMVYQGTVESGNITDISEISQLKNLEVLEIMGQQISDITPIFQLKNLRRLNINCNPVTSLEGIDQLKKLQWLDICSTDISDLSPLADLPELSQIQMDNTYIDDISVIKDIKSIEGIHFGGSYVEEIPEGVYLRVIQGDDSRLKAVPDFNGLQDVSFCVRTHYLTDLSKINTAGSYDELIIDMNGTRADSLRLISDLKGIPIENFIVSSLMINSISELFDLEIHNEINIAGSSISTLEGIEHFNEVEKVDLKYCINLRDLTPLNAMENLRQVTLSNELLWMADQLDERIEVIIKND